MAVNTPPAANAGFGTAHDLATFNLTPTSKSASTSLPTVEAQIATIEHAFGTVQVIANETFTVPGSTQTYQLRSQDPHGPYGGPMLQLLSGHYPTGPNEIALTPGWRPSSTCRWATPGPRAARPSSASCRTPRACSTSSRSSRRAR